ncbi:hypothetical protein [Tianweitania sediminis]|uniref:Uncharacterized protein n=1 Tax=Tianweitania sediminis TaxID=1502156 RepID=A0A8J7QYL3_9HYPH|nr:hypothetical protein [Tianweitania sediminis]MBP0439118.1 hypothetical protein [Tianweitania sediminis]
MNKLSAVSKETSLSIRKDYPDEPVVYAVYDAQDLRDNPSRPARTFPSNKYFEAAWCADKRGDAVVIEIDPNGTLARGARPRQRVTDARLAELMINASADTAALISSIAKRSTPSTPLFLSPEAVAKVEALRPFGEDERLVALYDGEDMSRPVAVYNYTDDKGEASVHGGLSRAWYEGLFAVEVRPDGLIHGHESGPADGCSHDEYERRMLAIAGRQGSADVLAILIEVAEYWDFRDVCEACSESQDWWDPQHDDFPPSDLVTSLRARHAAAVAAEIAVDGKASVS